MNKKNQKAVEAVDTQRRTENQPQIERKKFQAPRLKVHENLPVITAGSVNLW